MKKGSACHWWAMVYVWRLSLLRLAEPLGQATGSGLPNQSLPTSGRPIKEKPLWLRKLESFECLRMQQRILNRLTYRRDRLSLSSDLLPRDTGRFIQNMAAGLPIH